MSLEFQKKYHNDFLCKLSIMNENESKTDTTNKFLDAITEMCIQDKELYDVIIYGLHTYNKPNAHKMEEFLNNIVKNKSTS